MIEHSPGGEMQDQDQVGITEKIQRNAALEGADLNDPMTGPVSSARWQPCWL